MEYKNQAVLGDMICPVVTTDADSGLYTVALNRADGRPYSIVELSGREKNAPDKQKAV